MQFYENKSNYCHSPIAADIEVNMKMAIQDLPRRFEK